MKQLLVRAEKVPSYGDPLLEEKIFSLLETLGASRLSGERVLLKPNWVSFRQAELSCTHPAVLQAVCKALVEAGAKVSVGDSPAFGSTAQVARASRAQEALRSLPVRIVKFTAGPTERLPCGVKVRLAKEAVEADVIVNVPRFKAHCQLLLTLAVKNFFGCVVGLQKPLLHAKIGHEGDLFPQMLLEVAQSFPRRINLLDAVVAMEGWGPTGGRPRSLGFLLGAEDPVALDTAVYAALELRPEEVPLWRVAQRAGLPGAFPQNVRAEGLPDLRGFALPETLTPITFNPLRLLKGLLKRLRDRLFR